MNRKFSLTAAGAAFCLIVIFIHVISPVISGADRSTPGYAVALTAWRLSTFVVQGFILLAGVKLGLKFNAGLSAGASPGSASNVLWGDYYRSRLTRIVLPYIAWVVVYYLWFWLRGYFAFSPLSLLRYIFIGDLSAHFYFVVVIVQFYALAPLWRTLATHAPAAFALPAAALISLLSAQYLPYMLDFFCGIKDFAWSDRIFTTYLIWWVAGLYIGRDWDNFAASLHASRWFFAVATLLAGAFDAALCYNVYVGGVIFGYAEPVHMLYSICAIMLALALGGEIAALSQKREGQSRYPASVRIINAIDRAGYGIYLSHVLILSAVTAALDFFGIQRLSVRFIIAAVATYVLSLTANLGYYELKSHIKRRKQLNESIHG